MGAVGSPTLATLEAAGKEGKAGKRRREPSEHVRGGEDTAEKIPAASQAVLGEAQPSSAGAKTT